VRDEARVETQKVGEKKHVALEKRVIDGNVRPTPRNSCENKAKVWRLIVAKLWKL
jgi:hypothetical protein